MVFSPVVLQAFVIRAAAVVNDQIISSYDVELRSRQFVIESGGEAKMYRKQALDGLIDEMLFRRASLRSGHSVTDSEIEKRLSSLAQSQGVSSADVVAFYESRGIDVDTLNYWFENQLLRKKYVYRLFHKKAQDSIRHGDVEWELRSYERQQSLELRLQQIVFAPRFSSLRRVREIRSNIVQEMRDGASFSDIAKRVANDSKGIVYRDLDWQPEEALGERRLIDMMASSSAGFLTPVIEIRSRGEAILFYMQEKRIRTSPGVGPFRFDIAILSANAASGASDKQVEPLIENLEAVRNVDVACDENAALPTGIGRRFNRDASIDGMSLVNRKTILDLDVGKFSKLFRDNRRNRRSGVVAWLFVLCDRRGGIQGEEGKDIATKNVRHKLFNDRLRMLANNHLQDMRSKARIEIKSLSD